MSREIVGEKVKELRADAKIETFAMDGSRPAGPGPVAAPAPGPAPGPSAAPSLSGGAPAGNLPPPTLSPATAPDQLQKR
jgi:hypothetical protein